MRTSGLAWVYAVLLALLPWIALHLPWWAPAAASVVILVRWINTHRRAAEPYASGVIVLSCLVYLLVNAGGMISLGWLVGALVVSGAAVFGARHRLLGRPDAADLVAMVVWAVAIGLDRRLIGAGGWLAPILLLYAAAQIVRTLRTGHGERHPVFGPPTRSVRGTLTLREVVLGKKGTRRSVPIDLSIRAADSVAILCDTAVDAEDFARVVCGREQPLEGEVIIDATPIERGERLVAVVGTGEGFLLGDLALNVGALCEEEPDLEQLSAAYDGCALEEVVDSLGGQDINARGEPLSVVHRLLLLAARIVPSQYKVVVVVDPATWMNSVQCELWRQAVVRASVGRTAVMFTADRELAERASQMMEFRHGALRPFGGFDSERKQE